MPDATGSVGPVLANFRRTTPEFGNVEAYAGRHRHRARSRDDDTDPLLHAERATPSGSLKRLVDGSAFGVDLFSNIVPSLRGRIWEFRRSAGAAGFELATVTANIEVVLFTEDDRRRQLAMLDNVAISGKWARYLYNKECGTPAPRSRLECAYIRVPEERHQP